MTTTEDMRALRAYITAADGHEYDNVDESIVCVHITHSNLKRQLVDIRLNLHNTISDVKYKIYQHCGTNPECMQLDLFRNGQFEACLTTPTNSLNDLKKLGFFSVTHGMTIHVTDCDPYSLSKGGGLEDVSLIEKYKISEKDYDKRDKTVRAYKKEQLAKDPNWKPPVLNGASSGMKKGKRVRQRDEVLYENDLAQKITVGNRCEVAPGARRGTVAFVGHVNELNAEKGNSNCPENNNDDIEIWVGVRFDEPVGKGNGHVKGVKYFDCGEKYGGFILPSKITVGDFPEDEFNLSDDEEI